MIMKIKDLRKRMEDKISEKDWETTINVYQRARKFKEQS